MNPTLSMASRSVLRSLVPVICPAAYAHLAEAIVDQVEATLGASPAMVRRGFEAGLLAYDLGAVPFHRRRARALTGERAERYFAAWEHGTNVQYQLARALNQLMSMACYEQPEAMADVGYDVAPWIAEVRQKRLSVFRDEIAQQDRQLLAPDPLRPGVLVKRKERA